MTAPTHVGGTVTENGASSTTTYQIDFPIAGLSDGDYVIVALENDATAVTYDATTYNAQTWTLLATVTMPSASRSGQVFGRKWHTGDSTSFFYRKNRANADGVAADVWRGVDTVVVGTARGRQTSPVDTSTTTTILGITTTVADTVALAIGMEATSAAESGAFLTGPTIPSGWTQTLYRAQTGTINTIVFASKTMSSPGSTGDCVFTYQNTQANNGGGVMLGLVPAVTGGTAPTANFTSSADDLTVQFTETSTGTVTSRTWDFGDGSTSTAANPKHFYGSPGTYSVKLTVTDGTTPNTKTTSITIDGVSAWYWNGAAWKEEHITRWDGTTEKGTSEAVFVCDVGRTWPQMKAASDPLDAVHRGGSGNYVESSPIAYQAVAMRWPKKAMEVSLVWSASGHPWLSHDTTLDRMVLGVAGNTLPIASLTDTQIASYTASAYQTDNQNVPRQRLMPFVPISDGAGGFIGGTSWMELYGQKRVAFVEDKTYTHTDALLAILNANGGPSWFVWKQAGPGTLFAQIAAAGYDSWGYFFDSDMANFAAKQAQWTFVGMDFNSSDATLDPAIATAGANRVIMHIIGSAAQATRLRGKGVRGLMISNPRNVAPPIS